MNKLTCFELTVEHHVAHLVMNRADRMNALDMTFWRELDNVLQQLHQGKEARALVISSTGKHFSAGMSLEAFGGSLKAVPPSLICWVACKLLSHALKLCAYRSSSLSKADA